MMNQLSQEPAVKADIVQLQHALNAYAKASRAEIQVLDERSQRTDRTIAESEERLNVSVVETRAIATAGAEAVVVVERRVDVAETEIRGMGAGLDQLAEDVNAFRSTTKQAIETVQANARTDNADLRQELASLHKGFDNCMNDFATANHRLRVWLWSLSACTVIEAIVLIARR